MSLPLQKLPRRHAQRKTLYYSRHKTPPLDLSSTKNPQAIKPQAKKRQKVPISDANDSSAASNSDSDSDSESDSSYSSNRYLDSEAEHYRKIRAEFVVAGPNLHVLNINYQRTVKRYIDKGIIIDLRNWIPTLGLNDSEVEKSALYVKDLCVLQNSLWESPINIFASYMSTRPTALVKKIPLLYEDIEFQVFPPLIKGRRPTIQLILNLQHIKRSSKKKKP
ncbi:hypothetical protein BKA61DRAFT_630137 [Leptodontidium sp. MPI-SDFR-AT-0119]|nr:hypothetical protein BKA61DRAFT_630137 [Leptodontidium sp. MPI-SDFR-AT-0119]